MSQRTTPRSLGLSASPKKKTSISWLTESGSVALEHDLKNPKILIMEELEFAKVLRHWLDKKYETRLCASNEEAYRALSSDEFRVIITAHQAANIDAFNLIQGVGELELEIPILIITSDKMLTVNEEAVYSEYDVLRKPLGEAMLMTRIQKMLDLHVGKIRNLEYKKHLEENMAEIERLRKVANEKERTAHEVLSAMEAPIVAITGALAKVLVTPGLEGSGIKKNLEDIMELMMGDVYRPALERVLTSDMDPVAISLLKEYWSRNDEGAASEDFLKSKKPSLHNANLAECDVELVNLSEFSFDCWKIPATEFRSLLKRMFLCWEDKDRAYKLDEQKLDNFLIDVEKNYLENPYHSFRHAFDVTQTLFSLLMEIQNNDEIFSAYEVLAMLISSLCHDIGHVGRTNKFLVSTRHKLAMVYNDKSVLEQFHASKTFELLFKPQNNFLCDFNVETTNLLREWIIDCILGTDMAEHFALVGKLEPYNQISNVPRDLLMKTLVHFADISNVTKEWSIAYKWSTLITTEFFQQGDVEKELGLPVEAFMDRNRSNVGVNTANFIKFVCRKFFNVAAKLFPILEQFLPQMEENLVNFEKMANNALDCKSPEKGLNK